MPKGRTIMERMKKHDKLELKRFILDEIIAIEQLKKELKESYAEFINEYKKKKSGYVAFVLAIVSSALLELVEHFCSLGLPLKWWFLFTALWVFYSWGKLDGKDVADIEHLARAKGWWIFGRIKTYDEVLGDELEEYKEGIE